MRIPSPNYTQTPNDLFDHWLPLLKESELKVLLVIMRKTFGWHKIRDRISISQLSKLTGLTEETVVIATKSLQSKGVILKEVIGPIGKQETFYELIIHEDSNNSYPSDQPRTPLGFTPPGESESQKKATIKETNLNKAAAPEEKKEQNAAAASQPPSSGEDINYISPGGKQKCISSSEIYRHFLKLPFKTETLQKAIKQVKEKKEPIGNVLKLLEIICKDLENKSKPQLKYTEQSSIPKSNAAPGKNIWELNNQGIKT